MKKIKALKNSHTSNSKIGMGDHYGSGIKQKVGRMREDNMAIVAKPSRKTKKAPRSLV